LPRLYWLARHAPGLFDRVAHILWPKDCLRYHLRGEYLTDYKEAGGAALLDWDTMNWVGSRLEMIGLDPVLLPPLRWPHEDAGALLPQVAASFGLSENVRIIVGAGDVLALITGAPPMRGR
jgi:xylulokinase